MLGSGLVINNESALYTNLQMWGLFGSAAIVIAGIWLLTQKHNYLVIDADQEVVGGFGSGGGQEVKNDNDF